MNSVRPDGRVVRAARVSADRVFELASHLTERDREIVLCLYDHQLLTTDQLELLFFSSKRRAQDRLFILYRQAAGALVARRGGSDPRRRHSRRGAKAARLAAPRRLGLAPAASASARAQPLRHRPDRHQPPRPGPGRARLVLEPLRCRAARHERLRPDAGFLLDTPAGAIECWLELDRGTETQERLESKLHGYWNAEQHLRVIEPEPRNVLFVVPGKGRIETLRRALAHEQEEKRERARRDRWHISFHPTWPMLAATASELHRQGPLAAVLHSITDRNEPPRALADLPARRDLGAADPALALGRRWRHDQPDFWERLSPLHRRPGHAAPAQENANADDAAAPGNAPEAEAFHEQLQRLRQAEFHEIQTGPAGACPVRAEASSRDLRPSGVDGLMPDPEEDLDHEEVSWR